MSAFLKFIPFLFFPTLLIACGGGSGGDSPPGAPAASATMAPDVVMEASATWSIPPAEVQFTTTTAAARAEFYWSFGDGAEARGAQASHTYAEPGIYTPEVTIVDTEGRRGSAQGHLEVVAAGTYELSGAAHLSAAAMIDGDVNDPHHPRTENDTPETAQPIHSAATVAGFATRFPTNRNGDAMAGTADRWDYYQSFLLQDQAVTLEIAGHAAGDVDFDLYLLEETGALVSAAKGTGPSEQLQAPAEGTYLIAVEAVQGSSGYLLCLDAPVLSQSQHSLTTTADFVADEAIVSYRPAPADRRGATPLAVSAAGPTRPQLVALSSGPGVRPQSLRDERPHILTTVVQDAALRTLDAIKALRSDPQVRTAAPNFLRTPTAFPNDPYYHRQWHYDLIGLPQIWDRTGSSEAVVAVLDSGVFLAHPDLADNLTADGYDFISSVHMANDGDGIDPNPDDPGDQAHGGNSSWHGTHVAGTVAAVSDNGLGVSGAARNTRIMPIRVLGVGGGTDYDIIQGMRYAAGLLNDSGLLPQRRADVINLSLGGGGYNPLAQEAIRQVRAAGVIVIAAAGNQGSSTPSYPAAYDGVIAIGAVGADSRRAPYSNYGAALDLMAPGGIMWQDIDADGHGDGVLSTSVQEQATGRVAGYAYQQGTSMAAPHVAGVAALMKTIYPELTPAQFSAALGSGSLTDDLGLSGWDELTGYGLIDASRAIAYATELREQNAPADLAVEPRVLNFGGTLDYLELELRREGEAPLRIDRLAPSADWIKIFPETLDSEGFGRYRVAIERSALPEGQYSAEILVQADDGQEERVALYLQVSAAGFATPAVIHLELRHAASGSVVRRQRVVGNDGRFPVTFTQLTAEDYGILAGTDLDNDGRVCEPGEICQDLFTLDAEDSLSAFDLPLSAAHPPAAGAAAPGAD